MQSWSSGGNDYQFALEKFGDATTLNVTVAVHRSRFVEFIVKPPKS
jgi:hypothetical protein